MRNLLFVFMVAVVATSCGNKSSSIKYGEMTSSELVSLKGEPIREEQLSTPEAKMFIYEDDEKYQINDGVVVNSFRNPISDERMLIYWKHKFKNNSYLVQKLNQKVLHTQVQEEYKFDSAGVSVIYDPTTEQVVRVVEYAAE